MQILVKSIYTKFTNQVLELLDSSNSSGFVLVRCLDAQGNLIEGTVPYLLHKDEVVNYV